MAGCHAPAATIALAGSRPARVAAQGRGLADRVRNPATLEEAALVVGIAVAITLVVGAIVLTISTSYVRTLEDRIGSNPLNAGAIGLGTLVGGVVVLAVVAAVAALLVDAGAPDVVGLAPLIPALALSVGATVANTIGIVAVGSLLLRRGGTDGEPNPWLALVVGTIVVQVLYLVPLVNVIVALAVVALATGAMVGQWWRDRTTDPHRPKSDR